MLLNLHIKNLALIDEIDINFADKLNILTGETGAGKSIIIGSINIALGGKVSKDILRDQNQYGLVELLFSIENEKTIEALKNIDIEVSQDNELLISRKILNNKTINKVNDETVTITRLKEISEILIDLHAQHEHQSLLKKSNHLEILDKFGHKKISPLKEETKNNYKEYVDILMEIENNTVDEEKRQREIDFIQYEIKEIENARLVEMEDEELEKQYKFILNSKNIAENLTSVYQTTAYDSNEAAGEQIGNGLRILKNVVSLDDRIKDFYEQLENIDGLLNDFNRELSDYMNDCAFSNEDFKEIEQRLNLINNLKAKYGNTIKKILEYKASKEKQLIKLVDYQVYMDELNKKLVAAELKLQKSSENLSKARKKEAKLLEKLIKDALVDLNFLDVEFEMNFEKTKDYSKNGFDDCYFMISTNPGEKLRPLWEVASGGELSRIMLAIKSVLADVDYIETLIFDEIDVGISGRTAQKVSEKLALISKAHQVISITHLPQIAAMADEHFIIEKMVSNNKTKTNIKALQKDEIINELARLIGGVTITDTVINSAREMKEMATNTKIY